MAWVFAAGVCDPRPGGYPKNVYPNQQWALKQSWEPTSKMFWDLGLRWHPEKATKWLAGGGQFALAEIVNERPDEPSFEELAEQFADEQFAQMKAEIERVKDHGTPYEKKRLMSRFKMAAKQSQQLAEMLSDGISEIPDDEDLDKHNRKGKKVTE